jgi:hypothetical protein
VRPGGQLGGVVVGDRAAQGDAAVGVEHREGGFEVGSTDMNRLRTRTCPSASSGRSASVTAKLSSVGQPDGRETRTIWRGTNSSEGGDN